MTKLSEIRQLAGKIESVEGVEETLAAADAEVIAYNPDIDIEAEMKDRPIAMSSLSHSKQNIAKKSGQASFSVEMKGSGTATVEPKWAKYLKACGTALDDLMSVAIGAITGGPFIHGETITGAGGGTGQVVCYTYNEASVVYFVELSGSILSGETITGSVSGATATTSGAPAAAGKVFRPTDAHQSTIPSLTIAANIDGLKKTIRGARGNVKIPFKCGEAVVMEFNFSGAGKKPEDEVLLTGMTLESVTPPNFQDGMFKINNSSALIGSFELSMDNTLTQRDDPNSEEGIKSYAITGRQTTAIMDPELEAVADRDLFGNWLDGVEATVDLSFGVTSGNMFRFFAKKVQYTKVANESKNGLAKAKCNCRLNGTQEIGNDEWALLCL